MPPNPPRFILFAGVIAAFGAGKLPGVLPAIQTELSISLIQASLLVAMFQLSGAAIGVFAGALADRFGPRRQMQFGLLLIGAGSLVGAASGSSDLLLLSRCVESLGFILTVLPGPSLLRRSLAPDQHNRWLGAWGAYMPTGAALGLVIAPLFDVYANWRLVWVLHAGLCLLGAWLLLRVSGHCCRRRFVVPGRGCLLSALARTVDSTYRSSPFCQPSIKKWASLPARPD